MDLQTAFNLAVAFGAFLGGWILNTMWQAIRDIQTADKSLTDKVAAIEVLVAGTYVTRPEHGACMARIEGSLQRIEDKIDRKVDKS